MTETIHSEADTILEIKNLKTYFFLEYRRAFQQLMEQKGWDDPDIVMEEETVTVHGYFQ